MARLGAIWADGIWNTAVWDTSIWAQSTNPALVSATLSFDGDSIRLLFDRAVTFGAGGNGGFVLAASGGAATLTYSSGDGTAALVYTSSRTLSPTETVTLDYTQPGNGVEDLAGNDLLSFSDEAVVTGSSKPWKSAALAHNASFLRHKSLALEHNSLSLKHNA